MAKAKTAKAAYRCTECGWQTSKWVGRCGECQTWGSVTEAASAAPARVVAAGPVTAPARPIGQVDVQSAQARPTGLDELDRVLGAVLLLAGEPGIGKSTLLLEVAAMASAGTGASSADGEAGGGKSGSGRVLYVTGEESAEQVRLRADRVGAITDGLYLAAESE